MRRTKHQAVSLDELHRLMRGWDGRDDAALAILAGTFLEDRLGFTIKIRCFVALPAKGNNENILTEAALFNGYGPLSSFYAKIDMAYALGLFVLDIRNDFHIIRSIRNSFAHALEDVSFKDKDIIDQLAKLKCLQQVASVMEIVLKPHDIHDHPKHTYSLACAFLAGLLAREP